MGDRNSGSFQRVLRRGLLAGLLGVVLVPASAHAGVVATHVADFNEPTYIASPPGDTHRVFIVQQDGTIRIIKDGAVEATPFLQLGGKVTSPGSGANNEEGLLSMAFSPDYATSRRFYVYYTSSNGGTCTANCPNVVSEFIADTPDSAPVSSERVLVTLPHPGDGNHNGGQLQFGPDGDLYISVGDGGGGNDTHQNAQKTSTLLGKILRVSPGTTDYAIPGGNPYGTNAKCINGTNGGSPCPEVWWYGMRNPWRFSFDSATGDMAEGDVGEDSDEEINFAHPNQYVGGNFGWPCYEGLELNQSAPSAECTPEPVPVPPVLTYHHTSNCGGDSFCGNGVIGGYVMHDPSLPSLNGCYVYGDLSNAHLRVTRLAQPAALGDTDLGPSVSNLSSLGVDASGHLWAADISGPVYRLDSDGNGATMPTCPPAPAALGGRDSTPAKLHITRRKRQHVLKRRYLTVTVSPNELATITARGRVSIRGTRHALKTHSSTRQCFGLKHVTLHLRISRKTTRRIRRALRHHRRVVAKLTVTSKDASSNLSKARHVSIRIVG